MADMNKLTIDKQDIEYASKISVLIDNEVDRKRAYASVIALKAFEKYLKSIHLKVDTQSGLHKVPQFFQEFDLVDFYYKNINLDIRIMFSENDIYIPKKHFEYSIQPDLYIAVKTDEHFSQVEVLGFFESRKMSKARSEKFYYLNSVENLRPIEELTTALETITPINRTSYDFNHEKTIEQFTAYLDKEISSTNKLKMVRHLIYCANCRENLIDFSLLDYKMNYLNQYSQLKDRVTEEWGRLNSPQAYLPEANELPELETEFSINPLEEFEELQPQEEHSPFDLDDIAQDFDLSSISEDLENNISIEQTENIIPNTISMADELIQTSSLGDLGELNNDILPTFTEEMPSQVQTPTVEQQPLRKESKYDNMLPELDDIDDFGEYNTDTSNEMGINLNINDDQKYNYDAFDSKLKDLLEIKETQAADQFNTLNLEPKPVDAKEVEELKKELLIDEKALKSESENMPQEGFLDESKPQKNNEDEDISVLYGNEDKESGNTNILPDIEIDSLENVYRAKKPSKDLKGIVLISAAVVVLTVGAGALIMNKDKIASIFQPKTVAVAPMETTMPDENGSDVPTSESMPEDPNALPKLNADSAPKDINKAMTDVFSNDASAVTITKISWEVPEDLAKNDVFKKYLQIAGKNLQLNLQNDLLTTTDFAYNDKIKVFLQIDKDNKIKGIKVVESSGSEQIDNIVLKSIKDTLKYINLPVIPTKNNTFELTLVISF